MPSTRRFPVDGLDHILRPEAVALATGVIGAVTAVAAVRRGALTLAIAAILGGNCFDALTVAIGDIGLLVGQARGPGRVGFEGVLLIGTYISIVAVLSV